MVSLPNQSLVSTFFFSANHVKLLALGEMNGFQVKHKGSLHYAIILDMKKTIISTLNTILTHVQRSPFDHISITYKKYMIEA